MQLSFERNEVYECGAALLTILANPQEIDEERSGQLYLSLCGKALWLRRWLSPEDCTPITVKPEYVFRDPEVIDLDAAYGVKRVGERMVAGRMAIPFLQQAQLGRLPSLPKEIQRLSLNQMAEFVLDDAGQAETGNVEQRIWRRVALRFISLRLLRSPASNFAEAGIRWRLKPFSSTAGS